jgi:hypothetical protein
MAAPHAGQVQGMVGLGLTFEMRETEFRVAQLQRFELPRRNLISRSGQTGPGLFSSQMTRRLAACPTSNATI